MEFQTSKNAQKCNIFWMFRNYVFFSYLFLWKIYIFQNYEKNIDEKMFFQWSDINGKKKKLFFIFEKKL